MRHGADTALADLAETLRGAAPPRFVDVYLERVHEVVWRRDAGGAPARYSLRREGAAVRCDGTLRAADGCDRVTLARLLDVSGRRMPVIELPPYPAPPAEVSDLLAPDGVLAVRWRWSWAAVVRSGRWAVARRPVLGELTLAGGRRRLGVWPPAVPRAGERVPPRVDRRPTRAVAVLLGPGAAAVLLHEIVGHRLEADITGEGGPLAVGETAFRLPLDVTDDPLRPDLPGGFSIDDEGVVAAPRQLVAGGRVAALLGDRGSAALAIAPAGNGRRSGVHAPPRPRISNLVVAAPGSDLDALRRAAAIEVPALLAGTLEASSAGVWLGAEVAFVLRRGVRSGTLGPVTLRAALPAAYAGITGASGPGEAVSEPGWCRKHGEVVPTGALAPHLLVEGLEVR